MLVPALSRRRLVAGSCLLVMAAVSATPMATAATKKRTSATSIAYLSASSANTWLASSKKEMAKVAAKNNVKIVEFDGQFKADEQTKQIQDVIASGKYKGIVLVALNGPGIVPDVQAALKKGIKVVVLNQVVGPRLDTSDPQLRGMSASVLAAPSRSGDRMGQLVVKACAGKTECRVVYIYGIKGIPIDDALKSGLDSAIKSTPSIKIVAEGEGKYLGPDGGLKAVQDILQKTPDFDVVVGADQSIQGAEIALKDAGKLDKVKLIGLGGSEAALTGLRSGTWFGGVFGAPGDEGRLAMEAMVSALKSNKVSGGIDPLVKLPDQGLMTKDNVSKFTAQWAG